MSKSSLTTVVNWFGRPSPGHVVQFYPRDKVLLDNLQKYIGTGIRRGEFCLVIATGEHIQTLDKLLGHKLDLAKGRASGQYITLDAAETLSTFMVDGLPDKALFAQKVGGLIAQFDHTDKPIRAYGEMVALLWRQGNETAVIQLEQLWNDLADEHRFSLFCAYPELHFIMHPSVREEIQHYHTLATPALVA